MVRKDATLHVDHQDFSVILAHPHTGTLIPQSFLEYLDIDSFYHTLDNEFYLDRVYPRMGSVLLSDINRYVVNLARGREQTLERKDMFARDILKKPLENVSMELYYDPFHFTLQQLIERMRVVHGKVLIIDCHSLNSVGLPIFPDAGKKRAEFVVGTLDGTSCDPRLERVFVDALNDNHYGWKAVANDPYKGGFVTKNYHADDVHVIQLETVRALFMHEHLTLEAPSANALHYKELEAEKLREHLEIAFTRLVSAFHSL